MDNWKLSIGYILESDMKVHFRVDYLNLSTNLELADAVCGDSMASNPPLQRSRLDVIIWLKLEITRFECRKQMTKNHQGRSVVPNFDHGRPIGFSHLLVVTDQARLEFPVPEVVQSDFSCVSVVAMPLAFWVASTACFFSVDSASDLCWIDGVQLLGGSLG